ncbi:MAG: hypothetical protein NTY61_03165 [Candidatus Parcubacteria bacterium]|nr:hypothetical protein [Candidatus Parcubacteria bacterium]
MTDVWMSIILFATGLATLAVAISDPSYWFGIAAVLLIAMSLAVSPFIPSCPCQEVTPGVVLNNHLGVNSLYCIGKDVPTEYENGDPNNSGYIVRWWRWIKVVYIGNNIYDHRVADHDMILYRTAEQVVLSSDKIVDMPKHVEVVVINAGADLFWRHDHYGQPQEGFEMLVRPKDGSARIEKWVFN